MNLNRKDTVKVELGRTPGFFETLNDMAPANSECAHIFTDFDEEYQPLEDGIETAGEATGIDENNEEYTIVPYTNRKPPVTRPTWPF